MSKSVCIWCGWRSPLVNNKPYCYHCLSSCVRECASCHKPYPNLKHFETSHLRCNSCEARLEKKRKKKKVTFDLSGEENMEKSSKNVKPNKLISDDEEEVLEIGSRSPSPPSSPGSSDGESEDVKVSREHLDVSAKKKKKKITGSKLKDFFGGVSKQLELSEEKKRAPKRRYSRKAADADEIIKAEQEFAASLAKYNRVLGKKCEFTLKVA